MSIYTDYNDDITFFDGGFEIIKNPYESNDKKTIKDNVSFRLFLLFTLGFPFFAFAFFICINAIPHAIICGIMSFIIIVAFVIVFIKKRKEKQSEFYGRPESYTVNENGIDMIYDYNRTFIPWNDVTSYGFIFYEYNARGGGSFRTLLYVSSYELDEDILYSKVRFGGIYKKGFTTWTFMKESVGEDMRKKMLSYFKIYAKNGSEVNYFKEDMRWVHSDKTR